MAWPRPEPEGGGQLDAPTPDDTTLYRAVSLSEARDLEATRGFRQLPFRSYEEGKWFAVSFVDAVRWGRAMQAFPHPEAFRVVAVRIPTSLLRESEFRNRLDAIGPAYCVRDIQLPALNRLGTISIFEPVFEVE